MHRARRHRRRVLERKALANRHDRPRRTGPGTSRGASHHGQSHAHSARHGEKGPQEHAAPRHWRHARSTRERPPRGTRRENGRRHRRQQNNAPSHAPIFERAHQALSLERLRLMARQKPRLPKSRLGMRSRLRSTPRLATGSTLSSNRGLNRLIQLAEIVTRDGHFPPVHNEKIRRKGIGLKAVEPRRADARHTRHNDEFRPHIAHLSAQRMRAPVMILGEIASDLFHRIPSAVTRALKGDIANQTMPLTPKLFERFRAVKTLATLRHGPKNFVRKIQPKKQLMIMRAEALIAIFTTGEEAERPASVPQLLWNNCNSRTETE